MSEVRKNKATATKYADQQQCNYSNPITTDSRTSEHVVSEVSDFTNLEWIPNIETKLVHESDLFTVSRFSVKIDFYH